LPRYFALEEVPRIVRKAIEAVGIPKDVAFPETLFAGVEEY
jgi:hypothetical protein